jgi:hypothetical protein
MTRKSSFGWWKISINFVPFSLVLWIRQERKNVSKIILEKTGEWLNLWVYTPKHFFFLQHHNNRSNKRATKDHRGLTFSLPFSYLFPSMCMMFFNSFDLTSSLSLSFCVWASFHPHCPTHKIILNKHFFIPPSAASGGERRTVRCFVCEKSDDLLFLEAKNKPRLFTKYLTFKTSTHRGACWRVMSKFFVD